MSNIQKINDVASLSDKEFFEKYGQIKEEFVKEWEEEKDEGVGV